MVVNEASVDWRALYRREFGKIAEDSSYSAQTYYEASKGADFWGRSIVFIPALAAAVASILVAVGLSKLWSVAGAVSATISATSSFMGIQRQAAVFRTSGNAFTVVRHEALMWHDTLVELKSENESEKALKALRKEYRTAVNDIELPNNRYFRRAQKRVGAGVLEYADSGD